MKKPRRRKTQSEISEEELLEASIESQAKLEIKFRDLEDFRRQETERLHMQIDQLRKSLEESERNLVNAKSELDEARQRLRSDSIEKIRLNAEREAYQAVAMQAVTRR